MNRFVSEKTAYILFTLFVMLVSGTAALAQELPKIAVYATGNAGSDEKTALGTRMLSSLVRSGRYRAVERSNEFLDELDKELVRQYSGAIDDDQISALGKQWGVNFICIANITPAFGEFQVSARIINVETAEVVLIGDASGQLKTMNDLERLSNKVVSGMLGMTVAELSISEPAQNTEPVKTAAPSSVTHTLTVNTAPQKGGTVSRDPDITNYNTGTNVTISAKPAKWYEFAGWLGLPQDADTLDPNLTLNITSDMTLTAAFKLVTYSLTVNADTTAGTVSRDPEKQRCNAGTKVTVTAKPKEGYKFTRWTGAPKGVNAKNPSIMLSMTADVTLTANFERIMHTLTVNAKPKSGGKVLSPDMKIMTARRRADSDSAEPQPPERFIYEMGTKAAVTADPNKGYDFAGWSGAITSVNLSDTVTMNDDMTLTANFKANTWKKTVLTIRWTTAMLAAGGFIGTAVYNEKVKSEYDEYSDAGFGYADKKREKTEEYMKTRDILRTLGVIGLSGLTVTLFF